MGWWTQLLRQRASALMLHAARGSRKNLALCLSGQPRGRNSVADLQGVSWPKEERRAFLQENYQVRQDCHEILLIKYHYQGCKVYSSFFRLPFLIHFSASIRSRASGASTSSPWYLWRTCAKMAQHSFSNICMCNTYIYRQKDGRLN